MDSLYDSVPDFKSADSGYKAECYFAHSKCVGNTAGIQHLSACGFLELFIH